METPKTPAMLTKSMEAMKSMLSVMPIEQILKFRQRMKEVHSDQLKMVEEVLLGKGYVEPHHDILTHGRE